MTTVQQAYWPQNTILTTKQAEAYREEICQQFTASIYSTLDPSIPEDEELYFIYLQTKGIANDEEICDEIVDILVMDADVPAIEILSNSPAENRVKLLRGLVAKFTTWRQLSIVELRERLYKGWVNLDTGWLSDLPTAENYDTLFKICSDSKILLQAYVDILVRFNHVHYTRYFAIISLCYFGWEKYREQLDVSTKLLFSKRDNIYYSPESNNVCSKLSVKYVNDYWHIGSNCKTLLEKYIKHLKIDFPLGVYTLKVTKDLQIIFCSPRCQKSYYYNLDKRKFIRLPPKGVYMHKQYRLFSQNKDFLHRVVNFYRQHRLPTKFFHKKLHPILYQYFTVINIYS